MIPTLHPNPPPPANRCDFCGAIAPGVRCLGGWWLCDDCDGKIQRVPGATAGARIEEALMATNTKENGR